ncbi:HlyD family type I secretion periplasmic adaptor subunit [Sneathiella sp. P13V-1]|uniref:HlyD family type I secretion periplasmic adaptor subunit n=1 Tax=Sneathiella sp. P13V-1 TaxID=2697366 RepID=UPI00187B5D67|nr:HlyD family type I secretion periplasmic adaptor subunit [Sneathiella sp. P13V-1]MBE7638204.1 HlyD family type I secretion periplasmic adaptor subunit [Sneathiella sp. P13V-1]
MADSLKFIAIDQEKVAAETPALEKSKPQSMRLGQSIMLEESGPSSFLRISVMFGFIALMGFILWAQITEIDEVAVASGEVIPSGTVQTIQHIDGGTINSISISEGDIVEQGQVLLTLDPTDIEDDINKLTTQHLIWELTAARLKAFTSGQQTMVSSTSQKYAGFLEEQQNLLRIQRLDLESQQNVIKSQIDQRTAELTVLQDQIRTLENQLAPLREQMEIREGLLKNNTVSRFDFLESRRQLLKEEGQLEELVSKQNTTEQAIIEAKSRLEELNSRIMREALAEMSNANAEALKLEEELSRLEAARLRLTVRSPVDGIVQGLDVNSVGTVVKPGNPILSVVPVKQELIVEARIRPEDIGFMEIGQQAVVKFTTYNYARYGSVEGKLSHISATTFEDDQGESFYKGKILLDKNFVGEVSGQNMILPGMTALADIHSGQKTLMDYLLKPIHTTLSQSFRER